ncbi:molybdate transport system ATP-binding protein [Mucilaginibacter pineti]|uniref:Molybdate transport system ATP-binding protein n=1 Tax=Mucilaginibacter pineti TaxID=1391627 RepID=A0A1G6XRV5_9SPHI|nr:ATP-binding cassette domain-containing protein [Mucilaginibacter pineti]SDD80742.1 molybdate transport system ATP-binding protein [Mucilaginibacter pineti]
MSDILFSINDATVRYLNNTLLKNLTFTINNGQNWALIGQSGSGKSALLQTIAGRFNITGGSLTYNFGQNINNSISDNKSIGINNKLIALVEPKHHFRNLSNTSDFYYQQRYNSSDSEDALTVDNYLSEIKAIPRTDISWTLTKTLDLLNLNQLRNKQLIKLSNGETKRLMLAAALLKNPVLLLLDNPLTGLDVKTRQEFNGIIAQITASGISIIMATSVHEIPDAITNIAVLDKGNIIEQSTKASFNPSLFKQDITDHIDNAELSALLNTNKSPAIYNQIVKMNNVHIQYGEKVILDNVNWDVKPGDRWALLGPNGAGKSTLLSLINGDNPQAYANDIVLFDKKRGTGESIWDIKKKIGFVSPELHQYFPTDNSCLQVIESGYYDTLGLFRPSNADRAAIALRWMKTFEIDQYSRTLLKNVPASAQRLCLLARALIKNPSLLIFDEPCQGMDDHQQLHFKNVIDTLCKLSNVTLIYVTHYQHEIPDSVDKVLQLDKGKVV